MKEQYEDEGFRNLIMSDIGLIWSSPESPGLDPFRPRQFIPDHFWCLIGTKVHHEPQTAAACTRLLVDPRARGHRSLYAARHVRMWRWLVRLKALIWFRSLARACHRSARDADVWRAPRQANRERVDAAEIGLSLLFGVMWWVTSHAAPTPRARTHTHRQTGLETAGARALHGSAVQWTVALLAGEFHQIIQPAKPKLGFTRTREIN